MAEAFETIDMTAMETVMQINYFGCAYITQLLIPSMRRAGALFFVPAVQTSPCFCFFCLFVFFCFFLFWLICGYKLYSYYYNNNTNLLSI